jgi:hypothetical protein
MHQAKAARLPLFSRTWMSHMNQAYPKSWFDRMGLVSLLDTRQRFSSIS